MRVPPPPSVPGGFFVVSGAMNRVLAVVTGSYMMSTTITVGVGTSVFLTHMPFKKKKILSSFSFSSLFIILASASPASALPAPFLPRLLSGITLNFMRCRISLFLSLSLAPFIPSFTQNRNYVFIVHLDRINRLWPNHGFSAVGASGILVFMDGRAHGNIIIFRLLLLHATLHLHVLLLRYILTCLCRKVHNVPPPPSSFSFSPLFATLSPHHNRCYFQ